MYLKRRKGNKPLWIGLAVIFLISFITYKQEKGLIKANLDQKIQTFDLGFSYIPDISQIFQNLPAIFLNKTFGYANRPHIERIDIDIPLLEYKKILNDRERSLLRNRLFEPEDVKAKIRYRGDSYRAKIRLKGDLPDHWLSQYRMSFRVSIKNGNSILGFNKFSLHKPASRQHPYDQVFSELVKRTGNLASVHNYVNVFVNGTNWGVMNIEEHMSKELLEKQNRKDSLIVRFGNEDKGVMNTGLKEAEKYHPIRLSDPHLYLKVYDANKYLLNPLNRKRMTYIMEKQLVHNDPDLYDTISYGQALVTAAVWNDAHPLLFSNSRHYLNPYTLKLEPIITDAISPVPIKTYGYLPRRKLDPLVNNFLYRQISQSEEYINALDSILENVINSTDDLQAALEHYQDYFPLDSRAEIGSILKSNTEIVSEFKNQYLLFDDSSKSNDFGKDSNNHVQVFHRENGAIEIFNLQHAPVLIKDLIINNSQAITVNRMIPAAIPNLHLPVMFNLNMNGKIQDQMVLTTEYLDETGSTIIEPSLGFLEHRIPVQPQADKHPLPTDRQAEHFPQHIHARHYKDGRIKIFNLIDDEVTLLDITYNENSVLQNSQVIKAFTHGEYTPITISTNLKSVFDDQISIKTKYKNNIRTLLLDATLDDSDLYNPLITSDETVYPDFIQKTKVDSWSISRGDWIINSPVVIDGDLHIDAGTSIRFSPNSYIIIKGALHADGTKEAPVLMDSTEGKWKGIYVVNAKSRSNLTHVNIRNTTALEDGILALTGATTFYKSNVTMEYVQISGSVAEDALNIVESEFIMTNIAINGAVSDGIDFDFSNGEVNLSSFSNIGGDALDFSGSKVKSNNVVITDVKDKAISVGEATEINISNIEIDNVGTGVVSKDGSTVKGNNIKISNYQLSGIMSYMKKSFYPSPEIELDNVTVSKNLNAYLRQIDSKMIINGNIIPAKSIDVDNLYQSETMKK